MRPVTLECMHTCSTYAHKLNILIHTEWPSHFWVQAVLWYKLKLMKPKVLQLLLSLCVFCLHRKKNIHHLSVFIPSGSDTFVEVGMPRSPSHSANGSELKQMLASCKTSSGKRQAVELLQGTKNSHLQYVWIIYDFCCYFLASLPKSFTDHAPKVW